LSSSFIINFYFIPVIIIFNFNEASSGSSFLFIDFLWHENLRLTNSIYRMRYVLFYTSNNLFFAF
jgi:hypothetical protein